MSFLVRCLISKESDRLVRKPIIDWVNDLERKWKTLDFDSLKGAYNLDEFMSIVNQISLVCFYIGHVDIARAICESTSASLCTAYSKTGNARFFEAAIQPEINLLRIDGSLGILERFNPFYQNLDVKSRKDVVLSGFSCSSNLISEKIRRVLEFTSFYEPSKYFLLNNKLVEFSDILVKNIYKPKTDCIEYINTLREMVEEYFLLGGTRDGYDPRKDGTRSSIYFERLERIRSLKLEKIDE